MIQVPRRTRPMPFFGIRDKSATNWIQMNVVDHQCQRFWFNNVPIVTATGLPKESFYLLSPLPSDSWQPLWRILFNESNSLVLQQVI
jgi:hypothetical protein